MTTLNDVARKKWFRLTAAVLGVWFAAVAIGGYLGWFFGLPPLAAPALIVVSILVLTGFYFSIPDLRAALRSLGLRVITAFHVWRIGAALLFFWYGAEGLLPDRFVANAGWGDLLAGIFAALVVMLPFRRGFYAAAHAVGFADLVLAVGTGATLLFTGVAEMANIATFPVVLIPLFGVGLSAVTHIIAFDLLLRPEGQARTVRTAAATE